MFSAGGLSERTVGTCPGCGYPVLGAQPCAVCAPLLVTFQAPPIPAPTTAPTGPVFAA